MASPAPDQGNGEGTSQHTQADLLESGSEGSDLGDPVAAQRRDRALLDDDFLQTASEPPMSFKKKEKLPAKLPFSSFLRGPATPSPSSSGFNTPKYSSARIRQLREQSSRQSPIQDIASSPGESYNGGLDGSNEAYHLPITQDSDATKEGGPLDWLGDGPRRRVGYDDLTAIDWIFEYTKERQRLKLLLAGTQGVLGHLSLLWDASHVWLILIATGVASGILAALIDIASDWLGDLKRGYCAAGKGGGHFYLNRSFCCWGHDRWADCLDWTPWHSALHISSIAGSYIVEYILFIVFSVVFAVAASALVCTYATYAKHSGIPEIKTVLGGFIIRRFMGAWTLLVKSIGLCLAVASGLWLGKEGPLVHVACCCASLFMKLATSINENEARRREVLSAAASAGISVAFGSPIGGVLFSLEQLSYYFPDKTMWQSFVCAMVAAVSLQVMNPFRTNQLVLYQVTYSSGYHGFEMVPYALLGIVGGLYGGLFIKLNMKVTQWRKQSRLAKMPVLEVCLVAAITAVINYPDIFMREQSSEMVHVLFAECAAITDDTFGICQAGQQYGGVIAQLLVAAVLGFFLAAVTFGLWLPAGIILPSMTIGALFGRVMGIIVQALQRRHSDSFIFRNCEPDRECVTPGTYALVGAASALGGVTRMTVSIVVIMFELTGALTYVLPIMIAVMLSKWVGDAFGKKGIYESWIHLQEYPFLDNRDDTLIPDIPASQVMTPVDEIATIPAVGHTLQSLQAFLAAHTFRGFPVVADQTNQILLGYISRIELTYALKTSFAEPRSLPPETEVFFAHQPHADPLTTTDFRPWMDQTPFILNHRATLQLTADLFLQLGLKYVLFTDKGALRGLLTKKDVWYVLESSGGVEDGDEAATTPRLRSGEGRALLGGSLTPGEGLASAPFDAR